MVITHERGVEAPAAREPEPATGSGVGLVVRYALLALAVAIGILAATKTIGARQWVPLGVVLAATAVVVVVYATRRLVPLKYLLPGVLLMIVFQLYPVAYTFATAFTNYGDGHRVSKAQAIADLTVDGPILQDPNAAPYTLSVAVVRGTDPATAPFVYFLVDSRGAVHLGTRAGLTPVPASGVTLVGGRVTAADGYTVLNALQVNARSADFARFVVPAGGGESVEKVGLSGAYLGRPRYTFDARTDTILDTGTGRSYVPRGAEFVPRDGRGDPLPEGWEVHVGFTNFRKILGDATIRDNFVGILTWNIAFALISVVSCFAVGLLLALWLNHHRLRARGLIRSLLLMPYALPTFITALVWASMYNRDYGLINHLFGLHVDWLGNAWTARGAILLTNLWLGYPYMFIVCTGALQSIPAEYGEAARMDGASPLSVFRSITLPMIMVAVAPLLIATFAFNFNNFTLVQLLTGGGPFPASDPSAGRTDLLISYTYRLAFGGAGAQFGLAAAVSILIFFIVALISLASFRRTRVLEDLT